MLGFKKIDAKLLLFAFFVLGFSCLTVQTLIIQEAIISFLGNELLSALVLGFWLVLVAFGSWWLAKKLECFEPVEILIFAHVFISFSLPLGILFLRLAKNLFLINGQMPDFLVALGAIFFILLFFCPILGVFWTIGSRLYCRIKNSSAALTKVYFWETLGYIFAGLIFSPLLLATNDFFLFLFIAVLNFISVLFLSLRFGRKMNRFKVALLVLLIFFLGTAVFNKNLADKFVGLRFKNQILLQNINSKYGNLAATQWFGSKQVNFFQNGALLGSDEEREFNEQIVHLSLLPIPEIKKVLLIGQGFNGALSEILKYPVEKVDYLELDPKLIELARKYLSSDLQNALKDERVEIIFQDSRYFLNHSRGKFDAIILKSPPPSSLLFSRFFTQEFFKLAKEHLSKDGLLSIYVSFSPDYFSPELVNFSASVYQALKQNFFQVKVVPLSVNLFLASDSLDLEKEKIVSRFNSLGLKTDFTTPQWLIYHLGNDRLKQINQLVSAAPTMFNRDFYPSAYLFYNLFYLKQFYPCLTGLFSFLGHLSPFCFLLFVALFLLFCFKKPFEKTLPFLTALPDFTLLGLEIIFIFCFQIFYGYLYYYLALFIASIMVGLALGVLGARKIKTEVKKRHLSLIFLGFIVLELVFVVCLRVSFKLWLVFPLLSGVLAGLEFVFANSLYLRDGREQKTGVIYAADLIGACLAAVLIPLFFIPFFGVYQTLFFLVGLNFLPFIWLNFKKV